MTPEQDAGWWREAVVYQIYPRSFCDRSGDGIGDLAGISAHLGHVAALGADAIWLSPVYPSPMADFGYDVADYCAVDPLFGSLADLDALVAAAHGAGLRLILDWVPNHTSDRHPWFVQSRSSRADPRRDWYIWRDDRPDEAGGHGPPGSAGRRPNNWRAAFPGVGGTEFPPAWTWDEATGQWYLHLFLAEQPDLNWANPEVVDAMSEVLRFWLDRGVDGFRVDVVHALGKDRDLPDLPAELAAIPMCALIHDPGTHPIVRSIRRVVKEAPPPERVLIGEVVLPTVEQTASFYGTPESKELDLAFNFHPLRARWQADAWRAQIDTSLQAVGGRGGWPTWVLSNHDNPRHRTRYGSEARARAAAVLLLTLPGTPFLYAGEELGLEDAEVGPERQVDPGGRDGCRAPIPWVPAPGHGWAAEPWLPWPPEAGAGRDMETADADPVSTLSLYRDLLAARRGSPALRRGEFLWCDGAPGVLAYERRDAGHDRRLIAVNFTAEAARIELAPGSWEVEVSTAPGARQRPLEGLDLAGDEAVVLRPGRP